MSAVDNEFVCRVRDANPIEKVVGEYLTLEPGWRTLVGMCPFDTHNFEVQLGVGRWRGNRFVTAFNVRPTHGTFHCFGCGEGGSVIDFVMKIDDVEFDEAVEKLATRAGIT